MGIVGKGLNDSKLCLFSMACFSTESPDPPLTKLLVA